MERDLFHAHLLATSAPLKFLLQCATRERERGRKRGRKCDDWGLYYQATDGDDYHHSYNLR
jgi:hypothetical protein